MVGDNSKQLSLRVTDEKDSVPRKAEDAFQEDLLYVNFPS